VDITFNDKNGRRVSFFHEGVTEGQGPTPPLRWIGLDCLMIEPPNVEARYTFGIDELLWKKWNINSESLEGALSNLAYSLLRFYDRKGLNILHLSWLQFDRENMRIIEADEASFSSLQGFANTLNKGTWNDRWLFNADEISEGGLNRIAVAETRRLVNQSALSSFELFRKHLTAIARQHNKRTANEEVPKFRYEAVYTTAVSGELLYSDKWCNFLFVGSSSNESWRLRVDFGVLGLTNLRGKNPDLELIPGAQNNDVIWQDSGLSVNSKELAQYCCDTLLEMQKTANVDFLPVQKTSIRGVTVKNVLSFGNETPFVLLKNLNVIIGPNGAGKSNFLSVLKFLASLPSDSLSSYLNREDGALQWIWHGSRRKDDAQIAVDIMQPGKDELIRYKISFGVKSKDSSLAISGEEVVSSPTELRGAAPWVLDGSEVPIISGPKRDVFFIRKGASGELYDAGLQRPESPRRFRDDQSVLSKFDDVDQYPEITYFNKLFSEIRLYVDTGFGPGLAARRPQTLDFRNDVLLEDYSNLAAVLQRVLNVHEQKERFMTLLQDFYADARDLVIDIHKGFASIELKEREWTISARRLSDGTFRWIILLLILLDPAPAPLICLEEPEVGLHPDMIVTLATLLREASTRTQIIATTHSEVLVDALSETPESIIVCEKHDGATTLNRLSKDDLSVWLEEYTIGQLWRKGEIGGNRW
jgi:predicted ATPase